MKRVLSAIVGSILAAGVLWAGPAQATTEREGVVTDTEWTESRDPYLITDHLVINDLTIEAGVEVIVQGDYLITVAGELQVDGEPGNPVIFKYKNNTQGGWQGIRFAESQDGSRIQNAEISHAKSGIATNRRTWSIEESRFVDNTVAAEISGAPVGETATGVFHTNYVEDNVTGVRVAGRVSEFELNTITDNETGVSFTTVNGSYNDNNIMENDRWNATTCDHVGADMVVDARDNWWGSTTDSGIKSSICDGNDTPDHAVSPKVDITGFEVGPVPGAATVYEPPPSPSASPSVSTSPSPAPPVTHSRAVTLRLRRHLVARGTATVADGYAACLPESVTIRFRRPGGAWRDIKTVPYDAGAAGYVTRLRDRPGAYRATIAEVATSTDVCSAAASAKVRHVHR